MNICEMCGRDCGPYEYVFPQPVGCGGDECPGRETYYAAMNQAKDANNLEELKKDPDFVDTRYIESWRDVIDM